MKRSHRAFLAVLVAVATLTGGKLWRLHAQSAPPPGTTLADIRVDGALAPGPSTNAVSYVASFATVRSWSPCAFEDSTPRAVSGSDLARLPGAGAGCQLRFDLGGARRLSPQLTLSFANGGSQLVQEAFSPETNPPHLTFGGVSLTKANGVQLLNVTVQASDDIDMSQVRFSVTGLKASDLRDAGGLIDAGAPAGVRDHQRRGSRFSDPRRPSGIHAVAAGRA